MTWVRKVGVLVGLLSLGLAQAQGVGLGFRGTGPASEASGLLLSLGLAPDLEARFVVSGGGLGLEGVWRLPREAYGPAYLGLGLGLRRSGEGSAIAPSLFQGIGWDLEGGFRLFLEMGGGLRLRLWPGGQGYPRPEPLFGYVGLGLGYWLAR